LAILVWKPKKEIPILIDKLIQFITHSLLALLYLSDDDDTHNEDEDGSYCSIVL